MFWGCYGFLGRGCCFGFHSGRLHLPDELWKFKNSPYHESDVKHHITLVHLLLGGSLLRSAHIVEDHRREAREALTSVHQCSIKMIVVKPGKGITHIRAILPLVDGALFVLQSFWNPKPIQKNSWNNPLAVQIVASFVQMASPKVAT